MIEELLEMSTDAAWEEWGRRDPYFGVITDPRFRHNVITDAAKRELFASGELHVSRLMATIRQYVDPTFAPNAVLEFGCGVGRLLVPFSAVAESIVGVDVSPSMLLEARRNCDERRLLNVVLHQSDDDLSGLTGSFDLIHSFIVFQHIPVARGRTLFGKLLRYLRPGGVGAIHLTYSKSHFAATHGLAPTLRHRAKTMSKPVSIEADPEIQMNPYNLNEILFLMQSHDVSRFHVEFTNHGGELGVLLIFSLTEAGAGIGL